MYPLHEKKLIKEFTRSMFRFDHTENVPYDDFNTFPNTSKRDTAMDSPMGLSKGPVRPLDPTYETIDPFARYGIVPSAPLVTTVSMCACWNKECCYVRVWDKNC